LNTDKALECIPANKDVDGITSLNVGRVALGNEQAGIPATTPMACVRLVESFCSFKGKKVAIVGRGRTVGRPLVRLLLNRDATPVICHSKTENLSNIVKDSDIVIAAVGHAGLINREYLRSGQVVVDAGINFVNGKTVGDVNAEAAESVEVAALSPVPGGVGPITSALIFHNLLRCITFQEISK
jgi:methylenetetrahydrofolate dehydrogenase (NADP+)/methenyltetrahydrofolate cyclohydrolase